jgi:hypothetical protein
VRCEWVMHSWWEFVQLHSQVHNMRPNCCGPTFGQPNVCFKHIALDAFWEPWSVFADTKLHYESLRLSHFAVRYVRSQKHINVPCSFLCVRSLAR